MPIFEYRCDRCEKVSEFIELASLAPTSTAPSHRCPHCSSETLSRVMSAPSGSPRFAPSAAACAHGGSCGVKTSCGGPAHSGGCCPH